MRTCAFILFLELLTIPHSSSAQTTYRITFSKYLNGYFKPSKEPVVLETYDKRGLLTEKLSYLKNRLIYPVLLYQYNDKGQLLSEQTIQADLDTTMKNFEIIETDSGTISIERYIHRSKDNTSLQMEIRCFYNQQHEPDKKTLIETERPVSIKTWLYKTEFANGLKTVTEYQTTESNKSKITLIKQYNDKGDMISESNGDYVYTYSYQYNEYERWIKKRVFAKQHKSDIRQCRGEYRREIVK